MLSLCENWNALTHLTKVRLQRSKGVQLKDDFAMEARQYRERAHTGGTDDHGFHVGLKLRWHLTASGLEDIAQNFAQIGDFTAGNTCIAACGRVDMGGQSHVKLFAA